jgi:uncharacterized ion transporter superfamily protein YfcC
MPRKSKNVANWAEKEKAKIKTYKQYEKEQKQAENDFTKFFWLLIFTILVIITVFSLVERSRLETVILIVGIAVCALLYKIGGKS